MAALHEIARQYAEEIRDGIACVMTINGHRFFKEATE